MIARPAGRASLGRELRASLVVNAGTALGVTGLYLRRRVSKPLVAGGVVLALLAPVLGILGAAALRRIDAGTFSPTSPAGGLPLAAAHSRSRAEPAPL